MNDDYDDVIVTSSAYTDMELEIALVDFEDMTLVYFGLKSAWFHGQDKCQVCWQQIGVQ